MEDAKLRKMEGPAPSGKKKEDVPPAIMVTRCPQAPEDMNAVAAAYWQKIGTQLVQLNRLMKTDLAALETLCNLFSDVKRTRELMDNAWGGEMYVKYQRAHNEAHKLFTAMQKEFGLTPYSRGKIRGDAPMKDADPFDEFDA